jgi:hypothetical protein
MWFPLLAHKKALLLQFCAFLQEDNFSPSNRLPLKHGNWHNIKQIANPTQTTKNES